MSLESVRDQLPDYAKDLRLNLSSLIQSQSMTAQQLWGTLLASAMASKNSALIQAIQHDASGHLDAAALHAVGVAHALMSMTNVYYRFTHLVQDTSYQTMPAQLRMTALSNPGVEALDFECWTLAVSVINACSGCINAHERQILKHGGTRELVQNVARVASVVFAVAQVLDTSSELALTPATIKTSA